MPTSPNEKQKFKIYDENENEIKFEDINENMQIMCVLEIQGIRCSSSSFQIDILVKQMMVLKPVNLFEKCILKSKSESSSSVAAASSSVSPASASASASSIRIKQNQEDEIPEKKTLEEMELPTEIPIKVPTDTFDSHKEQDTTELCEVDFDINDMDENDAITIKQRKDMYYEMYAEARRKAKIARDLALSAYLEARRIKNTYMLEDILDSSDESDIDDLEEME